MNSESCHYARIPSRATWYKQRIGEYSINVSLKSDLVLAPPVRQADAVSSLAGRIDRAVEA
jgi:hypothetical protein